MIDVRRKVRGVPVVLLAGAAFLLGLFLSWFVVTPDELGPFGITVWFLLFFVAQGLLLQPVLLFISRVLGGRLTFKTSFINAGVASGLVTILLALNSLRQLSLKDIVLVSLLTLLIRFYLRRL